MIRNRAIPRAFTELQAAALLVWLDTLDLPQRRSAHRARLARALDLPRGTIAAWPVEACELALRAQATLDGAGDGLDKASVVAATEAAWPEADAHDWIPAVSTHDWPAGTYAHDWRGRADCGTE